jgi:hypothetical protein
MVCLQARRADTSRAASPTRGVSLELPRAGRRRTRPRRNGAPHGLSACWPCAERTRAPFRSIRCACPGCTRIRGAVRRSGRDAVRCAMIMWGPQGLRGPSGDPRAALPLTWPDAIGVALTPREAALDLTLFAKSGGGRSATLACDARVAKPGRRDGFKYHSPRGWVGVYDPLSGTATPGTAPRAVREDRRAWARRISAVCCVPASLRRASGCFDVARSSCRAASVDLGAAHVRAGPSTHGWGLAPRLTARVVRGPGYRRARASGARATACGSSSCSSSARAAFDRAPRGLRSSCPYLDPRAKRRLGGSPLHRRLGPLLQARTADWRLAEEDGEAALPRWSSPARRRGRSPRPSASPARFVGRVTCRGGRGRRASSGSRIGLARSSGFVRRRGRNALERFLRPTRARESCGSAPYESRSCTATWPSSPPWYCTNVALLRPRSSSGNQARPAGVPCSRWCSAVDTAAATG